MKWLKITLTVIFTLLCVSILVYMWKVGAFASEESFKQVVLSAGVLAPILFVFLETLSIIVLFLPCMLGYPVATACFGSLFGFVLNYISAIVGALCIYFISKAFGEKVIKEHISKKHLDKYLKLTGNVGKWECFLFIAFLLPIFPDNALAYIASLSNMKFRRYLWICVLAKPWQLLLYSYGYDFLFNLL